jgi:RHS repeat-associated protein
LAYNHQGLPVSIKQPSGNTATLNYDAKGRLTNQVFGGASSMSPIIYTYDAADNLTGMTNVGQASSLSQTFDAYNRLSSFKDIYGNLIQYRYDANGNLTNLIYPGGKNVYYAFDNLSRLTNVTDWSGRKTSIGYDLNSRITSITRPNGTYRTIAYDAAGQTTNIWEQMANSLPIAWFRFNWNANATMHWEFAAPLPHTNTPPTRTMTYDDDNRLATFNGSSVTSDLDGNLTSAPLTNGTFASYVYDARNRLLNVGGVTNVYDAMNNRIAQTYETNSTVFVVNPNSKLPQVLMRIRNGVTNYYVYGTGLLYEVTETATATNTLTYHFDYRGSTVALTGGNGLVTDRIEYSAYGLTTYRTGTSDTPFLFNGRYGVMTDPNGLLYMRARYYNPYLCRFLNPDPSGFKGGLNFYAYANGNPISYLDPFGLGAVGENVNTSWVNPNNNIFGLYQQALAAQGEGIDYFDSEALGNGLNNTVTAMGHTAGFYLYPPGWTGDNWNQIGGQFYSTATPENPAATPYVEGALQISGQAALTAFGVGIWNAAGGSTMTVSVGQGSPFHVIYGADGEFVHAAGEIGSQTIRGISSYALPGYEATAYGQVTGIPVLFPQAVTATGGSATTCVTAAMRAFFAGWGL